MNYKKNTQSAVKKTIRSTFRSITLSFALLIVTVMTTHAQGIHLGIKGGANIFKVTGESLDQEFKFGYNVGAFAEINFPGKWGIQPEVLFNSTRYRTSNNFSSIYSPGIDDFKGSLNYLSIPILLTYRPINLLSLQIGPQFGILTNNNGNLVKAGSNAFKSGDFSLVGGAQLNILKFKVGARYVLGLTNVNDVVSQESWKNTGFQVYVGFRIF